MMKVCIVGYGAIGPVHAEAVAAIDGAELYAICDCNREVADAAAREHQVKAFYDYNLCLKDKEIDCVHICTPHYLHFSMITKALDAGKYVVVEKPAVMKKEEWDVLFANYDTSKVFPIVQNRTNPCVQKLKEISGDLGKLRGVKGIVTWFRDEKYYQSASWRGTWQYEGGGVLINQAIHTLDLMVYFAGAVREADTMMMNSSLKGVIEVEDTVVSHMTFESGAKGIFYATNGYSKNTPVQIEWDFEKAEVIYTHGRLYLNGEGICSDSDTYAGKIYWGGGHKRTLMDFYVNHSSFCLNDIRNTMDAMFQFYKSERKTVILNVDQED